MDYSTWGEYISVALLSGFKFLPGVAVSLALGLNLAERILCTGLGGALGVVVFTLFGGALRGLFSKYYRRRALQDQETATGTDPNPGTAPHAGRSHKLWQRFGLMGVTVLVPFLMPAVATAIALSFGTPRDKIIRYMVPSILLWALLFGLAGHPLLLAWQALGLPMPS